MTIQTLFGSTVPALLDIDNGAGINLGTLMTFSIPGKVNGIRWYVPLTQTALTPHAAFYQYVSESVGTDLADLNFGPIVYGSGWNTVLFNTPVPVVANQQYVASVWTQHYAATNHVFDTNLVNGSITGIANGVGHANGRFFQDPSPNYPTTSFNASSYFVDVLFDDGINPSSPFAGDDSLQCHIPEEW